MSVGLKGNVDGSGAIQVGGSDAITISTGLASTFAGTVTIPTGTLYPIVSGTVNAGGTNPFPATGGPVVVDFTGIPSWVKRVTVMFSGVSTSGTSGCLLQLGYQSPVTSTGYVSGTTAVGNNAVGSLTTSTAGILAASSLIAAQTLNGSVIFSTLGNNIWVAQGSMYSSATATFVVAGSVTLSGTLDRVRITTVNGTDTFDAGSINILYE